jgi:hypothetical protein
MLGPSIIHFVLGADQSCHERSGTDISVMCRQGSVLSTLGAFALGFKGRVGSVWHGLPHVHPGCGIAC